VAGSRRTGVASWLAVLAAGLLGCNEADKRFVELSNQGVAALDIEDYVRADAIFCDALKLRQSDPDVRYYLGLIALRGGRFQEAADHLGLSVAGDPARAEAHLTLAKAHYELHQTDQAERALGGLFKVDSGHPQGHMLAARLALDAKDRAKADAALRAAIAGDPGFVPAYQMLGRLYVDVGAYDAARLVLQEGLKFNPESVELREALGLVLLDLGRPDRARSEFEAASLSPRARPNVQFSLAAAHLQLGDREAAVGALRGFLAQSNGILKLDDPLVVQAAQMVVKLRRTTR